jgi:hypothetical protein
MIKNKEVGSFTYQYFDDRNHINNKVLSIEWALYMIMEDIMFNFRRKEKINNEEENYINYLVRELGRVYEVNDFLCKNII